MEASIVVVVVVVLQVLLIVPAGDSKLCDRLCIKATQRNVHREKLDNLVCTTNSKTQNKTTWVFKRSKVQLLLDVATQKRHVDLRGRGYRSSSELKFRLQRTFLLI